MILPQPSFCQEHTWDNLVKVDSDKQVKDAVQHQENQRDAERVRTIIDVCKCCPILIILQMHDLQGERDMSHTRKAPQHSAKPGKNP